MKLEKGRKLLCISRSKLMTCQTPIKRMGTPWIIHTMEECLAEERNTPSSTWTNLTHISVDQKARHKNPFCMIPFIYTSKPKKTRL